MNFAMNKTILLLLLLSFVYCSTKTEKPIPERTLEGWAGNPDDPNKTPFEYYYIRVNGKSRINQNPELKENFYKETCIHSITKNAESKLMDQIIDKNFGINFHFNKSDDTFVYSSNDFKLELIRSTDWDYDIPSIRKRIKPLLKEIKIKDCKPTATSNLKIPQNEWKESECILYVHIPYGRDRIVAEGSR